MIWAAAVLLFVAAFLYSWCGGQSNPRNRFVLGVLFVAIALWLTGTTLLWIAKGFLWAVAGAIGAFVLSVTLPVLLLLLVSILFGRKNPN